ncbi:MAG: hypothetical protein EOP04_14605, partial [Proteobacteria bacterium]
MKNKPIIFSVVLAMSSVSAFAGGSKGNGGDAIVCRDTRGAIIPGSVELLDYYEARTQRKSMPLNLQAAGSRPYPIVVREYAKKLASFHPEIFAQVVE